MLEQGRLEDAAVLAQTSLDIFDQARVPEGSLAKAAARARIGEVLVIQGRWVEALAEFEAAAGALKDDPEARGGFAAGNVSWALAQIYSGQPESVGDLLQGAFDKRVSQVGHVDYVAAEMRGTLALASVSSGDKVSASNQFRAVIQILVDGAGKGGEQVSSATATNQRLSLILEGYIDRHFPANLQIHGNRIYIAPPRELHSLPSPPMTRLWRADHVRKAIWQRFPPSRHTSPVFSTLPSISSAYAGTGLRRRSSIKAKIFWNKIFDTATSASWNVT